MQTHSRTATGVALIVLMMVTGCQSQPPLPTLQAEEVSAFVPLIKAALECEAIRCQFEQDVSYATDGFLER